MYLIMLPIYHHHAPRLRVPLISLKGRGEGLDVEPSPSFPTNLTYLIGNTISPRLFPCMISIVVRPPPQKYPPWPPCLKAKIQTFLASCHFIYTHQKRIIIQRRVWKMASFNYWEMNQPFVIINSFI